MRPRPFQHVPAGAVSYGPGIAQNAGNQGPLKKAARIAVVTDKGVATLAAKIVESLGARVAFVDDGVVPDADCAHVNALAAKMKEANVDAILTVGGGSVMDTAKCAAAVFAKGKNIEELEGIATIRSKLAPIVCIPTTAGTGSEATQFAVVKDRKEGRKRVFMDASLIPVHSLLDPDLLVGLPKHITAATGVDAVTHAVEAMCSRMWNPFATELSVSAVRLLLANLPRALTTPDDVVARGNCLIAANMAGQAISSAMLGACHAFAHALGALKGVPHGVANGLFIVPVMKLNQGPAITYLSAMLGAYAIDVVEKLVHQTCEIPTRLSDVGVLAGDVDALVRLTLADADLATNPVALDEAGIRAMIEARL
jgi:alcohol dehydrogenase class IV